MKDFPVMRRQIFYFLKRALLLYLLVLLSSFFFSSCFSFRMSQKEIDKAFQNLASKPVRHQMVVKGHSIHYVDIGNDSLPVAFFVHGSPGSWSAFVDFMKDPSLLKKVKIVCVDRIGFGDSELLNSFKGSL